MAEQSAHDVVNSTQSMGEPAPVDEHGKSLRSTIGRGGEMLTGPESAEDATPTNELQTDSTNLAYLNGSGPNEVTTIINSANHSFNVLRPLPIRIPTADRICSVTSPTLL